jgi:DNA-binding transcriptional LysR family regulator
MDLDSVQAFVAVVRADGFAAAGRKLGVPRSTLSRQVQRLEEELGVRLLERTTRALSVTEAGRSYFERCALALDALETASVGAREAAKQARGTLRLSAPIDIARELVAGMLPEFHRRHPEVELVLETNQRHVDLVADGFDLALRGGERLDDSSMVARKLGSSVFGLYASHDYLAGRGAPADARELAEHVLIAFAPQASAIPWRLVGPEGSSELRPRAWLRANDMGFLQAAIASGAGIGLGECTSAARDPRLQRVLPGHTMHGGTLYAVYPSARRAPAKVRVFVSLLVEHTRRHGLLAP